MRIARQGRRSQGSESRNGASVVSHSQRGPTQKTAGQVISERHPAGSQLSHADTRTSEQEREEPTRRAAGFREVPSASETPDRASRQGSRSSRNRVPQRMVRRRDGGERCKERPGQEGHCRRRRPDASSAAPGGEQQQEKRRPDEKGPSFFIPDATSEATEAANGTRDGVRRAPERQGRREESAGKRNSPFQSEKAE